VIHVLEIIKHVQSTAVPVNLFHFQTHSGAEVDLIIEHDGTLFPIEIKSTSRLRKTDARGIQAFRETYPKRRTAHGLIIAPVQRAFALTSNVWVLPWG
jgi:uncharacterized protein